MRARKVKCPWHEEVTPSCYVDLDTGRVHCFGCNKQATIGELIDGLQDRWMREDGAINQADRLIEEAELALADLRARRNA